jgi:uncharacterized membrane protein SpoIIM required for sporulation
MLIGTWRAVTANLNINIFPNLFILVGIVGLLLVGLRQYLLTSKNPKHLCQSLSSIRSNLADETNEK